MLDYKLIEALAAVVREGGFDRAAKALFITQSAVSQRIKLLEEQTGRVLLTRGAPPRATVHGREIIKHYLQVRLLENDLLERTDQAADRGFTPLAIGINADSLATWFLEVIRPFLIEKKVLLDLRVDDQDQTHRLLKDGEVVGCVSTRNRPVQGCRMDYLGCMKYRMNAAPEFRDAWFPDGLTLEAAERAPALIFNRKDELHHRFLRQYFGRVPASMPIHYVPSSEKFVDLIQAGLAYGMLPDWQSTPLAREGRMIDLAHGKYMPVELYWHCWNVKSELLDALTRRLVQGAQFLST